MSYHLPDERFAPHPAPIRFVRPQYSGPAYPLAQAPLIPLAEAPAQDTVWGIPKDVLIAIAVVLIAIAVIWWINQQDQPPQLTPNRSRIKKQSTAEMAKNLYKRLEERGGVNDTTLRSLQQLGRKR
jgi:hypothetical protein